MNVVSLPVQIVNKSVEYNPSCRLIWVLGRLSLLDELVEIRWTQLEERIKDVPQKKIFPDKDHPACLNPNHKDRIARNRGLCQSCWRIAKELVDENKTTWADLIKAGKALEQSGFAKESIVNWFLTNPQEK